MRTLIPARHVAGSSENSSRRFPLPLDQCGVTFLPPHCYMKYEFDSQPAIQAPRRPSISLIQRRDGTSRAHSSVLALLDA